MSDDTTTITLERETRNRLFREKKTPDETYQTVLERLLSSNDSNQ